MAESYVIGVDYGTDSVRSIIVDVSNGTEIAASVFYYPRWKKGLYCNAEENRFRQHPLDYIEGLEHTIKECLQKAGKTVASQIRAISVDTTGSSPVAVNKQGTPLALTEGFEENPNAMFVLWKDHTSTKEAREINSYAAKQPLNYLKFVGGIYSSEWFWAKLLHVLRVDDTMHDACYSWVEHCDWIPFLLTGGNDVHQMKRSVCAAGHKALWAAEFGGLPPNDFFSGLDPLLDGFTERLFKEVYTSDEIAGTLSSEWADKLGLATDVVIGVGAFDAHMGAVGGQIEPYHLSKVMGTSTCDILVAPLEDVQGVLVNGICGQVNGSVLPAMMGMEAGQSAFGDVYAWFKKLLLWPVENWMQKTTLLDTGKAQEITDEISNTLIAELSEAAAKLSPDTTDELALDWLNGRRTPDANQLLTASVEGLNLGTDAPRFFRALAEATCFGAKAIVERFNSEKVQVKGLIGLGGVARKSPFIMQMMADIVGMPIRIHKSEQTCAAGAAMFAATAAGIYDKVEDAMSAMGQGFDMVYYPNKENAAIYALRYERYKKLGVYIESNS